MAKKNDDFAYVGQETDLDNSGLSAGDIGRGFAEADPPEAPEDFMSMLGGPPQDSGFKRRQGRDGEYGFVRRPLYKTDVERN